MNEGVKGNTERERMRMERIQRLLKELTYELERGFMENELDESLSYNHIVPVSRQIRGGVVLIEVRTRPLHRHSIYGINFGAKPQMEVVK